MVGRVDQDGDGSHIVREQEDPDGDLNTARAEVVDDVVLHLTTKREVANACHGEVEEQQNYK